MSVLVTGATGYLGRSLAVGLPGAEACPRVDLSSYEQAASVLLPWRWDAVVNAAGPAPKAAQRWADARETIVVHARIALNLQRLTPASCRLVHVSGMPVYGVPRTLPVSEDHPRNPVHEYGLAKVLAEDAFAGRSDVWLLRMGGLFSEERQSGAMFNFLHAARQGTPLRLMAEHPLVWDALHVADAVDAVRRALDAPGAGPLNVSYGEPMDLGGVARRIAKRYGATVSDEAGVEHPVFQADTRRARALLGWQPAGLEARLDAWWEAL